MKSGYCSIIIKEVDRLKHQGQWICAAQLNGHKQESVDEFHVNVHDANVAVAGLVGMGFGVFLVIGGIIIVTYLKFQKKFNPRRTTTNTVDTENISMQSNSSNDSEAGFNTGQRTTSC